MKRRIIYIFISFGLLVAMALLGQAVANTGIDRSKINTLASKRYPVTLRIGTFSFEGELARRSQITEEDIKKAIEEALNKFGKTETEIGEAEALVKKVARDNVFTKEDSERVGKEIRDFILKQTGLDTPVEIIEHIIGMNDRPIDEFLLDTAGGAAKDKAVNMLLGELGGTVTNVIEGLMFLSEKHAQDKQKWKNRADAVNAQRMLQNFYRQVNNNIERIAKERPQGWAISMGQATNSRYFTFFGIGGNLEIWTIDLFLNKPDKGNDKEPYGVYRGLVDITIDYEMSKFDAGIQDQYQDWIDGLYKDVDQEMGFKWVYKNEGSPTKIIRHLSELDYFLIVPQWHTGAKSIKIPLDFTSSEDYKLIEINRQVERTLNHFYEGILYQAKSTMNFKADNEEKLLYSYEPHYFKLIADGYTGTIPEQKVTGEVPWDSSIWEYWEHEKVLEIILPNP